MMTPDRMREHAMILKAHCSPRIRQIGDELEAMLDRSSEQDTAGIKLRNALEMVDTLNRVIDFAIKQPRSPGWLKRWSDGEPEALAQLEEFNPHVR